MAKRKTRERFSYDDFFPRSKPIRADDGIKAKTQHGAFGTAWWAKRWIAVLESFNIGARLQRGRSYARRGQVLNIQIAAGVVTAQVQGSQTRPYKVKIEVPVLPDAQWEQVIEVISGQALYAAKLLVGEMPQEVEESFKSAGVPLFPAKITELRTQCSCPDYSNPCKHIAAVYYLLGEAFDDDPFLIFALRGRTREQIIEVLRARRAESVSADSPTDVAPVSPVPSLRAQIAAFWTAGDLESFAVTLEAPALDCPTLKRLGRGPLDTQTSLEGIYRAMTAYALRKALDE